MILDMYRGIIQEGNWTRKGSYLRGVIDKYGFDKYCKGFEVGRFNPNKLMSLSFRTFRHEL